MALIQPGINGCNVLEHQRFQPSLRIHAPQRIATVAMEALRASITVLMNSVECRGSLLAETRFISRRTENDFFFDLKRPRSIRQSRSGKFQPVETE